ncbi:hypothetical protein [Roseivirga sp. UBA1976]|jgi:hypothetical protein|uniref:hypothetical protein n=1 Tax=Roseivirga sp. UBA1976 TaxID=1947386 RepID=UPI002580DA0A|nr:hypothetical protein [Roseivirga sp. UBA1976]|tara:strand:+ start:9285 stop:10058 length:774 start_codon:yes stop_codon:yes gene_type:complete
MTEVKSSFSALPAFNTIFHYRYKAFNWVIRAVLLRSIGLTIISFVVLFIFQNTITVDLVFIAILSAFLAIFTLPSVLLISQHLSQSDIREMQINFKSKEVQFRTKTGQRIRVGKDEVKHSIFHMNLYHKNKMDGNSRRPTFHADLGYWELQTISGNTYLISSLLGDFLTYTPVYPTKYTFRLFPVMQKGKFEKAVEFTEYERIKPKTSAEKLKGKYIMKSDVELELILANKKDYQKEAVLIADKILKSRKSNTNANT